jgi:methyl-accepting chemotaxis protein
MNHWTISRRLVFAFSVVITFGLGFSIFALVNASSIKTGTARLADGRYQGSVMLYSVQAQITRNFERAESIVNAPNNQKTKLATDIANASQDIDKAFRDYESTLTTTEERSGLDATKADHDAFDKAVSDVVESSTSGRKDAAVAAIEMELRPVFTKLVDEDVVRLLDLNRREAEQTISGINNSASDGLTGIIVGTIFEMVAVAVIAGILVRGISHSLRHVANDMHEGTNQVAAAASQVSAGSQSLAEGASEQAASLEQTSSSMEQMSSMTSRNSENALQANEIAKQTRAAADRGATDMAAMSMAMEAIKASSDDIAKIIKTIDEIAFQTNILALNAAVEAARAGEAGMGFAVVADEVRNLAQRSAQAAKETASKIEGAITRSGQGVEISNKVAATLHEIVTKVRRMDELVADVAAASREQTEGISQINSAIGEMDKVTQGNSASAERSAAGATELNAHAENMKKSVNHLWELIGGGDRVPEEQTPIAYSGSKKQSARTSKAAKSSEHLNVGDDASSNGAPSQVAPRNIISRRQEIPLPGDFKDF